MHGFSNKTALNRFYRLLFAFIGRVTGRFKKMISNIGRKNGFLFFPVLFLIFFILLCFFSESSTFGTFLEHLFGTSWNMLVSVTEAAKLARVTRQTINRHVRTGKLSAVHQDGKKVIDTSELIRVYGEIKLPDVPKNGTQNAENVPPCSNDQNKLIADLIAQVERLTKVVDHLTLRLEYKPQEQPEKPKARPEDDPDWPKEIKTFKDVALRNEIKAKYH